MPYRKPAAIDATAPGPGEIEIAHAAKNRANQTESNIKITWKKKTARQIVPLDELYALA